SRGKSEAEFIESALSPVRCMEIEYYLRSKEKMRAEVQELSLLVEAHDSKLVPTRVYRVKYDDKKGKSHVADFIMQQHGADWRVHAHMPPVELPKPATPDLPQQSPSAALSM